MSINVNLLQQLGAEIYNENPLLEVESIVYNDFCKCNNGIFIEFANNLKYLPATIEKGVCVFLGSQKQDIHIMQIIHTNPEWLIVEYFKVVRKSVKLIMIMGAVGKTSFKNTLGNILPNAITTDRSCNFIPILFYFALLIRSNTEYFICEGSHSESFINFFIEFTPDVTVVTNVHYEHISENATHTWFKYKRFQEMLPFSKKVICQSYIYVGQNSINEFMCHVIDSRTVKVEDIVYKINYDMDNFVLLAIVLFELKIFNIPKLYPTSFRGNKIILPHCTIYDYTFNCLPIAIINTINRISRNCVFIMGDVAELGFLEEVFLKTIITCLRNNKYIEKVYFYTNNLDHYIDNVKFFKYISFPMHNIVYLQGSRSTKMERIIFSEINKTFGLPETFDNIK